MTKTRFKHGNQDFSYPNGQKPQEGIWKNIQKYYEKDIVNILKELKIPKSGSVMKYIDMLFKYF